VVTVAGGRISVRHGGGEVASHGDRGKQYDATNIFYRGQHFWVGTLGD
jgi:hypothetical protein